MKNRVNHIQLVMDDASIDEDIEMRPEHFDSWKQHAAGPCSGLTTLSAAHKNVRSKANLEATNKQLKNEVERLSQLAGRDGLTGLQNHRAFQEKLVKEFERCKRYHTDLSLVLIDVDRFKLYNDSYGHPAGDAVLRSVAALLSNHARAADTVARYGGEEFAMLLPHTNSNGAVISAERLRKTVEECFASGSDIAQRITISLGVSTFDSDMLDASTLLDQSDSALYVSKRSGRNQVGHFRQVMAGGNLETARITVGGVERHAGDFGKVAAIELSAMIKKEFDIDPSGIALETWCPLFDLRNRENAGHTKRVMELTARAATICGMPEDHVRTARQGALLHDIGKMTIPANILCNPGRLSDFEWEVVQMHPQVAANLLSYVPNLREAMDIPRYHHECWDGTGYPHQLIEEEIPLSARLFAVVDAWDVLRHNRHYASPWADGEAKAYIEQGAGSQYCPTAVEAFLRLIEMPNLIPI